MLLIENNPEHKNNWESFQERNLLRKMNLALNVVAIEPSDLKSMSSEKMKEITETTPSTRKYEIDVPRTPEEFPDMGTKAAEIYPLPISHENQCTTLGVARNLDLFQEEFGFKSHKEAKYLPLTNSGKKFDLDQAYKRFAFLKKLEKHKEEQQKYEETLRGFSSTLEHSVDEELLVVVDTHFSDSDEDEDSDN